MRKGRHARRSGKTMELRKRYLPNTKRGKRMKNPLQVFCCYAHEETDLDTAWEDVVRGIEKAINSLPKRSSYHHPPIPSSSERLKVISYLSQEYTEQRVQALHYNFTITLKIHKRTDLTISSAQLVFP